MLNTVQLANANALCQANLHTITLYTGTDGTGYTASLLGRTDFNNMTNFRNRYCSQKLGSRNQKWNANYVPGIYLTDDPVEAANYGPTMLRIVCTLTPYADLSGKGSITFRKEANIVGGGPQIVNDDARVAALLMMAKGQGGITNYYTLRTPQGVTVHTYPP